MRKNLDSQSSPVGISGVISPALGLGKSRFKAFIVIGKALRKNKSRNRKEKKKNCSKRTNIRVN